MIRGYIKLFFFLSSYSPLFLILALRYFSNKYIFYTMLATILISNLVLIYILNRSCKMSGDYLKIKDVEDKSDQFLGYIITYIIPFLGFNLLNIIDLISVGIIFLMICSIYIRSDLIYMNPVLNFLKYNLYKVKTDNKVCMIVSKESIEKLKSKKIYLFSKGIGVTC